MEFKLRNLREMPDQAKDDDTALVILSYYSNPFYHSYNH